MLISVLMIIICFRVFRRTYKKSKEKDRTFQAQFQKQPNQIAAFLYIAYLPVMVLAPVKFWSPNTLMIDPSKRIFGADINLWSAMPTHQVRYRSKPHLFHFLILMPKRRVVGPLVLFFKHP